jgi:hypothetical protein
MTWLWGKDDDWLMFEGVLVKNTNIDWVWWIPDYLVASNTTRRCIEAIYHVLAWMCDFPAIFISCKIDKVNSNKLILQRMSAVLPAGPRNITSSASRRQSTDVTFGVLSCLALSLLTPSRTTSLTESSVFVFCSWSTIKRPTRSVVITCARPHGSWFPTPVLRLPGPVVGLRVKGLGMKGLRFVPTSEVWRSEEHYTLLLS